MKEGFGMKLIALLLLVAMLFSIWRLPTLMPVLGVLFLLLSLAISVSSILKKHKNAENPYRKITKDILILFITLLLVTALGGIAGMYANQYVSLQFGIIAGILSALVASFAVGYLVRWGMGMVAKY